MRRRAAFFEYVGGALWVLPFSTGVVAILLGWLLSLVEAPPDTWLAAVSFLGSSGQARDLLLSITSVIVTVIALVLGLSVVALQLTSTQFSPRLLRNFLRDRPTQIVLSVFMATFTYTAAGLYTVGVGPDPENFPRLAVSGSIAALIASLGGVVAFADHLSHAIQVDSIMQRVELETLRTLGSRVEDVTLKPPTPPAWAVSIPAWSSGYIVTVDAELLLDIASRHHISIALTKRIGEHVVAGRTLGQMWTSKPGKATPDLMVLEEALIKAIGIGFERTRQQDIAMGNRQLVDIACKALSPAVNDPYTAVQSIDHMSVIFTDLAQRPLGPMVAANSDCVIVVPSRRFEEYLGAVCGLIRRYGAAEPTVMVALLRLLENSATMANTDAERLNHIVKEAQLILIDAERETKQEADLTSVRSTQAALLRRVDGYLAATS